MGAQENGMVIDELIAYVKLLESLLPRAKWTDCYGYCLECCDGDPHAPDCSIAEDMGKIPKMRPQFLGICKMCGKHTGVFNPVHTCKGGDDENRY